MPVLSTRGVYGLMAVLEIKKASEFAPISIKEISEKTMISKNYLEQILNSLRNVGMIESIKGKNGGYYLAKESEKITFCDVFRACEKDFGMINIKLNNQNFEYFFSKCNEKLCAVFGCSIDKFDEYADENTKFLDFVI